jgi:hypothetical protein
MKVNEVTARSTSVRSWHPIVAHMPLRYLQNNSVLVRDGIGYVRPWKVFLAVTAKRERGRIIKRWTILHGCGKYSPNSTERDDDSSGHGSLRDVQCDFFVSRRASLPCCEIRCCSRSKLHHEHKVLDIWRRTDICQDGGDACRCTRVSDEEP